MIYLQSELR